MKRYNKIIFNSLVLSLLLVFLVSPILAQTSEEAGENESGTASIAAPAPIDQERVDALVKKVMDEAHIPGISLVLIKGQDQVLVKNYGYADLETQSPVTPDTLFELGSCSKSFTALAMLQLEKENMIKLSDPVSKYFPWFKAYYRDEEREITIDQLLQHISGIPTKAFGKIPESDSKDALENLVRRISGIELVNLPGRQFQYCNANYDIAGAILETATGMSYENYMLKHIFGPLGMGQTTVGIDLTNPFKSTGYKVGFGKPVKFDSPVYRGNFPAGYVVTSGNDIAKWLRAQLGITPSEFYPLMQRSHNPNTLLQGSSYKINMYSYGWMVRTGANGDVSHGGANPNFTSFVGIKPGKQVGVAVLINSSAEGVQYLGQQLLRILGDEITEEEKVEEFEFKGGFDKYLSIACYVIGGLIVLCLAVFLYMISDLIRGVRHFEGLSFKKILHIGVGFLITAPVGFGLYLVPIAVAGFTWQLALAWTPVTFGIAVKLFYTLLGVINFVFIVSLLIPYKNKESFRNSYIRPLPLILLLGFISGISGAASMFLVSISFFNPMHWGYLVYYIAMTLIVSTIGNKVVRTKMIVIANNIVYELRMKLITKIFATRFQNFEKIDSGRVYATLNNDTESISNSAGMVVSTITNLVTAIASFVYLSAISFLATLSTLAFALLLGGFYIIVGKRSRALMEKMRDTQNIFMKLIEGLVKGFREISMHHNKKKEYDADVEASCAEYRRTRISAVIKFVDANLISSSMILILLASICITFPRVFPDMSLARLISFIMVLLYMIGPITSIMGSFPTFIRIKVSWDRIQEFIAEIPDIEELRHYKEIEGLSHKGEVVESIEAKGVTFSYESKDGSQNFSVGPIDLEVKKGEILFIVGGNGSGKTTLAKLLTGLYRPEEGEILIDGKKIEGNDYLGEYFSIIFDNFTLFEKLYNIETEGKEKEIQEYLEILGMEKKVQLKDKKFSTIDLSSGQRKRLALLQCYLEDCPIYLFDEVAADQDPQFRKFFYHELLQRMKEKGKIIIAITHDDHYFGVADKIIKMDMGKIDPTAVLIPGKPAAIKA